MPYQPPIPDSQRRGKLSGGFGAMVEAEKLLQIAFVLPSAVILGWLAGAWADSHFHKHWLTLAGILFGSVSGMFYVIRLAIDAEKRSTRKYSPTQDEAGKEDSTGKR